MKIVYCWKQKRIIYKINIIFLANSLNLAALPCETYKSFRMLQLLYQSLMTPNSYDNFVNG